MTSTGAPTPEEVAKAQMKTRVQDPASGKPQPTPDAAAPAAVAKRDPAVARSNGKPASVAGR